MYFWNDGRMHQEIEEDINKKYKIKDVEAFATSTNELGELDVYDIDNNLNKYKKYAQDIEKKAKELFEVYRTNRK